MDKKKRLSLTVKYKLIILYVLLVIIPLTTATLIISNALSNSSARDASEYMINNLRNISGNLNGVFRSLEFIHTPILSNETFMTNLVKMKTADERRSYSDYYPLNQINDFLMRNHINNINNSNFYSIYFYSAPGKTLFSTTGYERIINHVNIETYQWMKDYKESGNKDPWIITHAIEDNAQMISCYKELRNFYDDMYLGVISVNVDRKAVVSPLAKIRFKASGYTFIADSRGNIISDREDSDMEIIRPVLAMISENDTEGYFETLINQEKIIITYYCDSYSGWKYIAVAPKSEINTAAVIIRNYSVFIYTFIIALFLMTVLFAYKYLYQPINHLFSAMRQLENGDFQVRLKVNQSDEIGYINQNFNNMVENIKKLIDDNYVNQLLKKDAQLKSVLSKINEHFLYNTLDSLHWTARQYNVPQLCEIIFSMSKFYRLSLSSGADVITIGEVMEIINSYIRIQKFRKQEKLSYEYEADPSLMQIKVLKYLFQPIVENSVVHGIEKKQGGGRIKVVFRRIEDGVRFMVEDNGKGISEEKLRIIKNELEQEREYSGEDFALNNINQQMKLFYSKECCLHIESTQGKGTTVWFDIPIIKEL